MEGVVGVAGLILMSCNDPLILGNFLFLDGSLNENKVGTRAEREERSLLVVLTWVFSSVQVGLAGGGLAMHSAGEGS